MPGDGHLCGPSGRLAAISSNLEFIPSVKGTGKRAKTFQGRLKKGGGIFFSLSYLPYAMLHPWLFSCIIFCHLYS